MNLAMNDLGNARRFVARCADTVRYCPEQRQWYIWDGRLWAPDYAGTVELMAKTTVEMMNCDYDGHLPDELQQQWIRFKRGSASLARIRAMVELAQTEREVVVRASALDSDPWVFNTFNGVVDLRTGQLLPHDKQRMITKLAPFAFDPEADPELWSRFLTQVVPDMETRNYIRNAVGYSLTPDMREECMFFLHGGGQNGKSTFVNAILNMMGDYSAQTSADTWLRKRGEGPRNDIIRLVGKRFVSAAETDMEGAFDEALLKQITGGDRITVNPKYRDEVEITPTWKIWLSANHRPQIKETEMAIWRRIRLVPFTAHIPVKDPIIKAELTGNPFHWAAVFNWALDGCLAWQELGKLTTPPTIQTAVNQYRREQDVIGQFLDDCCVFLDGAHIAVGDLYHTFEMYARAGGEKSVPKIIRFGNELTKRADGRVYSRKYLGRHTWFGVKLSEKVSIHPDDYSAVKE